MSAVSKKTLEDRFWPKVMKTETCWEWVGAKDPVTPYGRIRAEGGRKAPSLKAHRVAYELLIGPIPEGMVIDHICHNHSCVNPDHLRPATLKQNGENRAGAQSNSRSGIRGVHWHAARKKWVAGIKHRGQVMHIGIFQTIEEAEAAVVAKRLELFTHNEADKRRAA